MGQSVHPNVSVVIPTFNRAYCLPATLEAVFAQSYDNYEVIVVDDGSTDATQGVISKYGRRVRYLYQRNAGVSAARNAGVNAARGVWVAFLDSDDEWLPRKLEVQLRDLEAHSQAIGHMVDCCIVGAQGRVSSLYVLRGKRREYMDRPLRDRPLLDVLSTNFFPSTWIVKKKALEQAGLFDTEFRIYEDIDLLSRVATLGPLFVSCYLGANIQRRSNSADALSDLYNSKRTEYYGNICRSYLKLQERALSKQELRFILKELSAAHLEMALLHHKIQDWKRVKSSLWSAIATRPNAWTIAKGGALLVLGAERYNSVREAMGRKNSVFRRSEQY